MQTNLSCSLHPVEVLLIYYDLILGRLGEPNIPIQQANLSNCWMTNSGSIKFVGAITRNELHLKIDHYYLLYEAKRLTKYSSITRLPMSALNSCIRLFFKSRHRSSARLKNLLGNVRNLFVDKFNFLSFTKHPISSGSVSIKLSWSCKIFMVSMSLKCRAEIEEKFCT
jgi:hypothetical protein